MANTVPRLTSIARKQPKPQLGFAHHSTLENRLLSALSLPDRTLFIAKCERIHLVAGEALYAAGEPIRFVYFPIGSFASLLASTDKTSRIEVAMIGAEGMLGTSGVLDISTAPLDALVQGSGATWRMELSEFRRQIQNRPALSSRLARYLHVHMLDVAQMVTCTRFHVLEPRLARWLLMMSDRAGSDHFDVTQKLMSHMLGVRRASVTAAATSLQKRGLIRYHRGKLVICDRRGLELAACSCYIRAQERYEHHLG